MMTVLTPENLEAVDQAARDMTQGETDRNKGGGNLKIIYP